MADGVQRWSGTMQGHYYPGDADGQAVVVEGASLALEAYPMGTTTGLQKLAGTIHVDLVEVGSQMGTVVSFSASFTGNGALVRSTNS
jgi:hypothetical protein